MSTKREAASGGTDGQSSDTQRALSAVRSIPHAPQDASLAATLAGLRARFEDAVLAERWPEAAVLQREYHEAERERRRLLLEQSKGREKHHG